MEREAGIEPASSAWKAVMLAIEHQRHSESQKAGYSFVGEFLPALQGMHPLTECNREPIPGQITNCFRTMTCRG